MVKLHPFEPLSSPLIWHILIPDCELLGYSPDLQIIVLYWKQLILVPYEVLLRLYELKVTDYKLLDFALSENLTRET